MKIVAISDTHNLHRAVSVPEGDVLVHAGDLTLEGKGYEVETAIAWLAEQPHKYKIVIAGNHDWLAQRQPEVFATLMKEAGLTYLFDSEVTIEGFKFYGSPWQPFFFDWAFNVPRGALAPYWDKIPKDTDVLITHGPPFGILDQARPQDLHIGCEDLLPVVKRINPKAHIFGHIHGGYGIVQKDKTIFVNAAICDEAYRPKRSAITFEIL